MDHARLNRLADVTLAEFVRHLTRAGEAGQCWRKTASCCLPALTRSRIRTETARSVSRRALARTHVLARATEFFAARGRGFALWASEHNDEDIALEARGTAA